MTVPDHGIIIQRIQQKHHTKELDQNNQLASLNLSYRQQYTKASTKKIFKNKLTHNTKNESINEINLIIMPKKYILKNKKNTSILSWLN